MAAVPPWPGSFALICVHLRPTPFLDNPAGTEKRPRKTKRHRPSKLNKSHHAMRQPMPNANIKQQAHQLSAPLPANPPGRDVVYERVVRREIELGLPSSEANRTTPAEDVLKEF